MGFLTAESVPSRVLGLLHTATLKPEGGVWERDELLELVKMPEATLDLSPVINTCHELGWLEKTGSQQFCLVSEAYSVLSGEVRIAPEAERQRTLFRQAVIRDPHFAHILAWLLALPMARFPVDATGAGALSSEYDPQHRTIPTIQNANFGSLHSWVNFLGFGFVQQLGRADSLTPDPTAYFAASLERLCEGKIGEPVSLLDIIARAEAECPWLEGGASAEKMRAHLPLVGPRDPRQVCESTTLALRRLESRGWIELVDLSDAKAVRLPLGGNISPFSHIIRKEISS